MNLEGLHSVLRTLPWRQRRRIGCKPSGGLDRNYRSPERFIRQSGPGSFAAETKGERQTLKQHAPRNASIGIAAHGPRHTSALSATIRDVPVEDKAFSATQPDAPDRFSYCPYDP